METSALPFDRWPAAPPVRADEPRHICVAGHELTVFVEFPPLLAALLADLRQARRRIWVEAYILAADAAGRAIAEELKGKARAGLDVRLLYDGLGCQSTPAAFFADLQAAGVRVYCFHSISEALWKLRSLSILNRRDHRKLIVIDDRVAYFGGMNLIDNSTLPAGPPLQTQAVLPVSAGWRDVHVRLEGPQQAELAESFERSWLGARGEKVPRRPRAYRRAWSLKREVREAPVAGPETESIRFFDSGPGLKYSRAARIFTRLMDHASSTITLSMAYFIPVGRVLRALLAARRRGVRIRIVIPGISDVPLVQRATSYLYAKLLLRGFRLYERRSQMLHSKVTVIDHQWVILGSANLDPRSLWINLELLAVIRSPRLAAVLQEIFRYEIKHSTRLTLAETLRSSWVSRVLNSLAWALRWWL